MIALPDYINIEHDVQRAIERWENEGGWSIYADFTKARERETNDARPSGEVITVGLHPSLADNRRVVQGA